MPSVMMNADWAIRLTRLPAERNSEFFAWNKMTMTIRPTMTGSAPLSPERRRLPTIRRYSPNELASRSAEASGDDIISSSVGVGSWFTDVTAQPSVFGVAAPELGAVPVVIQWTAELVS